VRRVHRIVFAVASLLMFATVAGAGTRTSVREWRQFYLEARNAAPGHEALPAVSELVARANHLAREGRIPLAVLDHATRVVGVDGVESGTSRAFAFAALTSRTYRGREVTFVLAPEALVSDDPRPIAGLAVDLDDGAGFRALGVGEPVTAHYATIGAKTLRVRVERVGTPPREATAAFEVVALAAPTPDETLHVTASVPYLGVAGTGDAYVYLAPGHTQLENPVVLPEGFDLDNSMNWDELYALLNQEGLAESLRTRGFDEVVLNFTDATDYLERNAMVLVELIQQVEAAIPPGNTVALAGPSMGGLLGRYALAWLETQGGGHRVRTYISFDAPHSGADIPLGIQYWFDFFAGQSADAALLRDLLNRPAAREMLIYHYTSPPGTTGVPDPLRATWLANLAAAGDWPAAPRTVAIANGSGAGVDQGFAPGDQLILYIYDTVPLKLVGNVWAVRNAEPDTIFQGQIRVFLITTASRTVNVGGTQPWDGAPGGWRGTMAQMDTTPNSNGDIVALHPNHCFIPTVSALALDTTDPFYDVDGDPDLLAHTPFDVVYFPAENQEHVTVTLENRAWFLDEIGLGVLATPPLAVVPRLELRRRPTRPRRARGSRSRCPRRSGCR
jgi:hypothetical protein